MIDVNYPCYASLYITLKCKPSANCACAVPLIAFTLVARGESDTGHIATVADINRCGSRYTPFAVASCASKVHRVSGSGRGEPA